MAEDVPTPTRPLLTDDAVERWAARIVDRVWPPDAALRRAQRAYARWARRDWPARLRLWDDWSVQPVYSYAKGRWWVKVPGTAWGTLRPAVFDTAAEAKAFAVRVFRELWGLRETTLVIPRYEPPVRRWRLPPDALQHSLDQRAAPPPVAPRVDLLPGQRVRARGQTPGEQRRAQQEAEDLRLFLQWLDDSRPQRCGATTVDDALEARRARRDRPYAGSLDEETGTPLWPNPDAEPPRWYGWSVMVLQRPGERALYLPWVMVRDARTGTDRPYARWAFLTLEAAVAFCYDHGARWVDRRRHRALLERDRVRPFPLYVDPAWIRRAASPGPA